MRRERTALRRLSSPGLALAVLGAGFAQVLVTLVLITHEVDRGQWLVLGVAAAALAIAWARRTVQARRALRESERNLAEAQRIGGMGSWRFDTASGAIVWSAEMHRIFGTDPGSFAPTLETLRERLHEGDVEGMSRIVERLSARPGSFDLVARIVRYDGSKRAVRIVGESVADGEGVPIELRGTLQDVTASRARARALRRANERLRAFFRAAPVGLAVERGGVVAYVNQRLCVTLGRGRREIIGRPVESLWQGTVLRGTGPRLARVEHPRLGTRSVVVTRAPLRPGSNRGTAYAFLDISDRVASERKFQEMNAVLRGFLDHSDIAMYVKDEEGRYVLANRFLESALGLEEGGLVGRTVQDLYPEPLARVYSRADDLVLATGRTVVCQEPDEQGRVFLSTKFPIRGVGGDVVQLGGVSIDVTQLDAARKETQALYDRLQAVREEERTHLAREIHDELGGALTGIKIGLTRFLRRDAMDPNVEARIRELAGLVDGTMGRVRSIATRLRPAVLDELGLVPALEWLATDVDNRGDVRCKLVTFGAPPAELGEEAETHLFRIAQEGLTNALRHAHATQVSVEIGTEDQGLGFLRIRDDGCGIARPGPGPGGAGGTLGLKGMEERARMLAGSLLIDSADGAGTTVKVTFPIPARRGA